MINSESEYNQMLSDNLQQSFDKWAELMKELPNPTYAGQVIDVPYIENSPKLNGDIKLREDGSVDIGMAFGKIRCVANKNLEWEII